MPFRIVVVGGGPVGLMAAHILSSAGIDFVILEKHSTVTPELGNAIALWPQTNRVLDQLRLLQPLQHLPTALNRRIILTKDGNVYARNSAFGLAKPNHGTDLDMFHRHELLKALYDMLPEGDKAKVLTNKHVTGIESNDSGVRVTCADDTVEQGDMVIGADGVHSSTRGIMRELALNSGSPDACYAVNEERPYLTTFRVLYGSAPRTPDLTPGDCYESHSDVAEVQYFIGKDRTWFFAYSALDTPTREPVRYTQEDADEYAERVGDRHVTERLLFRDVYAQRYASGLTNLEEGVMKQWSWGRIVLAGDSAHKITPNLGLGFNSSVHDLVVLANRLRTLLDASPADVTTEDLTKVFSEYQKERTDHMSQTVLLSGRVTRLGTWQSGWRWFLDRYVLPVIGGDNLLVTYMIGSQNRTAPVLSWLDEPNYTDGWIPWQYSRSDEKGLKIQLNNSRNWNFLESVLPTLVSLL
ncbi:hypothetical protein BX600DRAFT_421303 [Xylariales sp. PMI_506]|nr:hypothetical protein BX600DRAFT_421303 [Xylariales sp. PMI_506]